MILRLWDSRFFFVFLRLTTQVYNYISTYSFRRLQNSLFIITQFSDYMAETTVKPINVEHDFFFTKGLTVATANISCIQKVFCSTLMTAARYFQLWRANSLSLSQPSILLRLFIVIFVRFEILAALWLLYRKGEKNSKRRQSSVEIA